MIMIEILRELKLTITWGLLYNGFSKDHLYGKQFSNQDVVDYAVDMLEISEDATTCRLACLSKDEEEEIYALLFELAQAEHADWEIEKRKLRVAIVHEALKEKYTNCIDGLQALTDLWIMLNNPSDSPHIVQGVENNISPKDYYTEKNYERLYRENKTWEENELAYLLAHQ